MQHLEESREHGRHGIVNEAQEHGIGGFVVDVHAELHPLAQQDEWHTEVTCSRQSTEVQAGRARQVMMLAPALTFSCSLAMVVTGSGCRSSIPASRMSVSSTVTRLADRRRMLYAWQQ